MLLREIKKERQRINRALYLLNEIERADFPRTLQQMREYRLIKMLINTNAGARVT